MRVVLYAHDMEPITILELSSWACDYLQERSEVMLPVMRPITSHVYDPTLPLEARFWRVHITAEKLHRNGEAHTMLFTHNEEEALLLKAAFLPGQQWALKDIRREEFAKGFMDALLRLS
jgi:hypothetical protein